MECQIGKFQRLQKQKLHQNKGGCSKQHVYHDQNIQTNVITKENNLDIDSNNSNQSNNERDHMRNQKEIRDQNKRDHDRSVSFFRSERKCFPCNTGRPNCMGKCLYIQF